MVKYKIEKMTEAFPRIQAKMEKARKKIDLPEREADILLKIMFNAKNAWDVCRAIWGEALNWEAAKEYTELWYLYDELYAYRNNNDTYFAQIVETMENVDIDSWHEERIFYIIEKEEILEWGEYKIIKISATYGNMYSYLVINEAECEKILSIFAFNFNVV